MPTSTPAEARAGGDDMDDAERQDAELDDELTAIAPDGDVEVEIVEPGGDAEVDAEEEEPPSLPRHPLVYALIVLVPLLMLGVRGFSAESFLAAGVAGVLVALAAIDIEHRVLPNRIIFPAIVVVLAAQIALHPGDALEYVIAGIAAAVFLALPLVVRRDAMGLGDVKLALLLGAATGWGVFGAIILGCLAIFPIALYMLVRGDTIRGATLPFGPFLAFGTILVLFMQ